jgi:translation initiation factor IF-2
MLISDNDIVSIIADTEALVSGLVKDTLAKGEGSKSASASDGGSASGGGFPPADGGDAGSASPADAGDPSSPPAAPVASAAASPDPAAAAPASAAPAAPGAPAPGAPAADPSAAGAPAPGAADPLTAQGPGDHQALVGELARMDPAHVAEILEACKEVLLTSQPPGGAPAPSPMEPSAPPAGLAQSEVGDGGLDAGVPAGAKHNGPTNPTTTHLDEVASNGGKPLAPGHGTASEGGKVLSPPKDNSGNGTASTLRTTSQTPEGTLKSEAVTAELASLRKANADLSQRVEQLIGLTTEILEKPMRKAVTGLDYVNPRGTAGTPAQPQSKSLSKAEITTRLNEKIRENGFSKADRELVNAYYDNQVPVSKIEHLLK